MPQPPKPASVLRAEGKSHRTKKELEYREQAESELKTNEKIVMSTQVKKNPLAKKEFKRLKGLLEKIDKDDALVQNSINRYCLMCAELVEFEEKREEFFDGIKSLKKVFEDEKNKDEKEKVLKTIEYFNLLAKMESSLISLDKQVMQKRKMLLDLEKENIMTIASQLRTIPKTLDEMQEEQEDDDMAKLFQNQSQTPSGSDD